MTAKSTDTCQYLVHELFTFRSSFSYTFACIVTIILFCLCLTTDVAKRHLFIAVPKKRSALYRSGSLKRERSTTGRSYRDPILWAAHASVIESSSYYQWPPYMHLTSEILRKTSYTIFLLRSYSVFESVFASKRNCLGEISRYHLPENRAVVYESL